MKYSKRIQRFEPTTSPFSYLIDDLGPFVERLAYVLVKRRTQLLVLSTRFFAPANVRKEMGAIEDLCGRKNTLFSKVYFSIFI